MIYTYNALLYRRYYYDSETGFYYLQSRYYDPVIGRFINADGYVSTGRDFLGTNMFAYCLNNPVCYSDSTGCLEAWELLGFEYDGTASDFKRLEAGLPPNDYVEWLKGSEERNTNVTRFQEEYITENIIGVTNIPKDETEKVYKKMLEDNASADDNSLLFDAISSLASYYVDDKYFDAALMVVSAIDSYDDYAKSREIECFKKAMEKGQSILVVKWEIKGEHNFSYSGITYYPWDEKTLPFSIME